MPFASRAFLGVGLIFAAAPAYATTDLIKGSWSRGDGLATVRIDRCGAAMCAVNTWVKDPSGGEKTGDRLVMSISPSADGKLAGTAYDPQRNLTYQIDISVAERNMKTRGCVLGGLLCKSVGWTKR
jgi:uncharacterized protein (DUF2147 family)